MAISCSSPMKAICFLPVAGLVEQLVTVSARSASAAMLVFHLMAEPPRSLLAIREPCGHGRVQEQCRPQSTAARPLHDGAIRRKHKRMNITVLAGLESE